MLFLDARRVRNRIVDCLELASAPGATEEDKKRLLHFVIVGGSPYAIEFAAGLQGKSLRLWLLQSYPLTCSISRIRISATQLKLLSRTKAIHESHTYKL